MKVQEVVNITDWKETQGIYIYYKDSANHNQWIGEQTIYNEIPAEYLDKKVEKISFTSSALYLRINP